MNITLVGFMGTGKTVVGKRLAKRLRWSFFDIDKDIEAAAKKTISQIFSQKSEAVFRRLERRCIRVVVKKQRQVIATGGGAFLDSANRAFLQDSGPVIALTAKPKVILERIGSKVHTRPLLAGFPDPLIRIKTLQIQRAVAYTHADLTVDTSSLSVDAVVDRIWEALKPYLCEDWQYLRDHANQLGNKYSGSYVVVATGRIIASGKTQLEAYKKASRHIGAKHEVGIYYIPLPEETVTAF